MGLSLRRSNCEGVARAQWARRDRLMSRGKKTSERQFLSLTCLTITLTAGLILKEDKKPSLMGERQFGRHFRRQFGRG